MGRRHNARRLAMQVLYQMDLRPGRTEEAKTLAIEGSQSEPATKAMADHFVSGVWQHLAELDGHIQQRSEHWRIDRISSLDKAILRLALFELFYEDTPAQVVVDEAIEIAKAYSGDDAHKFINGILGSVIEARKTLNPKPE